MNVGGVDGRALFPTEDDMVEARTKLLSGAARAHDAESGADAEAGSGDEPAIDTASLMGLVEG